MAALPVAMLFINPPAQEGRVSLIMNHYVGNQVLRLDSGKYFNAFAQPYSISKFRYYIGQVHLIAAKGKDLFLDEYYLVNENEPGSKIIDHVLAAGTYTGIQFILGVDSLHNCSGAQSGALDPENAMFWAWNTGYIFMKLEGNAPASGSPGHIFEFHIGGYKHPHNCIRNISLAFDKPLIINPGTRAEINIKADVAKILNAHTPINFSALSSVTDFHNATTIADNYQDMFSIMSINQ